MSQDPDDAIRNATAGETDEELTDLVAEALPDWDKAKVDRYVKHLRKGGPR